MKVVDALLVKPSITYYYATKGKEKEREWYVNDKDLQQIDNVVAYSNAGKFVEPRLQRGNTLCGLCLPAACSKFRCAVRNLLNELHRAGEHCGGNLPDTNPESTWNG
eukprot:GHVU01162382.1.p2 GENE.GHVU01162382.1~~GHVU01162382.1.p2  ORF type:complete len:107 (+),score=5.29 GHVU01162382.1:756-1076(+)